MIKKCRICDIELINENWSISRQKSYYYYCNKCSSDMAKKYRQEYKEILAKKAKEKGIRNKLIVINHYSNGLMSCNCCGENHIEFLTIDHIDCGNICHGKSKKIDKQCGIPFYAYLINNNFPEGYQILCFNCNCAKGAFGECPHKLINEV